MSSKKEEGQTYNINLHQDDVDSLIEVLNFTEQTAALFAQQELTKGSGINAANKMSRIASSARELAGYLSKHVDIGEPTDSYKH